LDVTEIDVSYDTDVARLKREARAAASLRCQEETCLEESDTVIITNATILTLAGKSPKADTIENGTMVVKGGIITGLGRSSTIKIPKGAFVIDAEGGGQHSYLVGTNADRSPVSRASASWFH
jgi:hypothetical protein